MKIKNLTPHAVNMMLEDREIVFSPEGIVPRCSTSIERISDVEVDGISIPITTSTFGEVIGLPEKEDGVLLIVSALVANTCKDRDDLVIPNEAVRDDAGRIIGCKSLGRV